MDREKSASGFWYRFLGNVIFFFISSIINIQDLVDVFFFLSTKMTMITNLISFHFCAVRCTGKHHKNVSRNENILLSCYLKTEIGMLLLSRSDFQLSDLVMNVFGLYIFVFDWIPCCFSMLIWFLMYFLIDCLINRSKTSIVWIHDSIWYVTQTHKQICKFCKNKFVCAKWTKSMNHNIAIIMSVLYFLFDYHLRWLMGVIEKNKNNVRKQNQTIDKTIEVCVQSHTARARAREREMEEKR